MKMARAVPVPCMSWDATPPSLPACNNGPKVANLLLSPTDHLLYFHHSPSVCYSITLHQMAQLFDIWGPWVWLLQCNRDRSHIDCQLLASRPSVAARLMLLMHWGALCETAVSDLSIPAAMYETAVHFFLFRTCLLPFKDVPIYLLQLSVTTFIRNSLLCEEEEKQ
jgi:hypothetical protein